MDYRTITREALIEQHERHLESVRSELYEEIRRLQKELARAEPHAPWFVKLYRVLASGLAGVYVAEHSPRLFGVLLAVAVVTGTINTLDKVYRRP
jgi:hypothetical protein